MTSSVHTLEKVQEASYKIAEPTVRAEGQHAIDKTLLISACKGTVKIFLHSKATRKIS
jgi:hypothetical protein